MVLDFGVVRVDRQRAKSTADSAVMAGMRAADGKTGDVYSFRAVCAALSFLRANDDPDVGAARRHLRLSLTTRSSATPRPLRPNPAVYDRSVTNAGTTYRVVIKSPYSLSDGGFVEEGYTTSVGDPSLASGCDQVGVIISESRKPGLGSLATSGRPDVQRAVGRPCDARRKRRPRSRADPARAHGVQRPDRRARPAPGAGSFIKVLGFGKTPGSIHVDSAATGSDCGSGSNKQLFQGKQADGIVAYGSSSPTGTAGIITSVATNNGKAWNVVSDALANVYGTTATSGTGVTKSAVAGHTPVGRAPVDSRYRLGVREEIAAAQTAGVWTMSASGATSAGWTVAGCSPTGPQLDVATKLFIDCPSEQRHHAEQQDDQSDSDLLQRLRQRRHGLHAQRHSGLHQRHHTTGAPVNAAVVSLSNNTGFCVRRTCDTAAGANCPTGHSTNRAALMVRQGNLDASGGLLRLCNTTAILLGGYPSTGCVPGDDGALLLDTPCATTGTNKEGNTRIDITGGAQLDWTAPDKSAAYISDKATRDAA